jgi:hypothetical protein
MTFGEALLQFASSVDIVSNDVMQDVKYALESYLKTLKFPFYEVLLLREEWVKTRAGAQVQFRKLETYWTNPDHKSYKEPIKEGEDYLGQTAYAFDRDLSLWITAEDGGLLSDGIKYVDSWSNRKDVPKYQSGNPHPIRTSIMLPVKDENRVFGVFNVESTDVLHPQDIAKEEMERMAKALSLLVRLNNLYNISTAGTKQAVQALKEFDAEETDIFEKPKLFVASAARADNQVMGVIERVLRSDECSKLFDVTYWKVENQAGDVTQHIMQHIVGSNYAICYFSEPSGSDGRYADNANVLFEAGMIHVLTYKSKGRPRKWIPIRESGSNAIPFDFATQRVLIIDRHRDGTLNAHAFEDQLLKRVKALIKPR